MTNATHEVIIPVDLAAGTFTNTAIKDGKLQLKELKKDDEGNIVYAPSGSWESLPIVIQDRFAAFQRMTQTVDVKGAADYKLYIRYSADSITWTEYAAIDTTAGNLDSAPFAKYAQLKIEFIPALHAAAFTVDDFTETAKYTNEWVNSDEGVLELKKHYRYKYERDESWKDEGVLLRKRIPNGKMKRIDSLRVEG
ncbi:hypothetical protein [Paenibacillus dendritiformis]|uniref:F5/8 type C domain-containing protein n=1 Tax=Paenibacillus dendritiformis C454 TaxID=1131935 RepID=H3SAH4_9BACL|nr:hypothetical protein [Paenibacillus dendritiformis]EHQ63977.1 hypothetical protein PDENDC454_02545 [Paenibacillus dendritiformis C454]CAH8772306.1 hypothetical protein H7S4_005045 [Paenibacillus dendritiformis]